MAFKEMDLLETQGMDYCMASRQRLVEKKTKRATASFVGRNKKHFKTLLGARRIQAHDWRGCKPAKILVFYEHQERFSDLREHKKFRGMPIGERKVLQGKKIVWKKWREIDGL